MSETFDLDASLAALARQGTVFERAGRNQRQRQSAGREDPSSIWSRQQADLDRRLAEMAGADRADRGLIRDEAAIAFSKELIAGMNAPPKQDSGGLLNSLVNVGSFLLEAIDTPRAMVTSAIKEVGDIFDDSEGTDFSFSELFDQGTSLYGNQAIGFGEVIEEFAPGLGEIEMFGVKPLDNLAGFLGEVVLDPFTWMTLGSYQLARQGSRGFARTAGAVGDVALMRKIENGGMAAASAADISRVATAAQKAGIKGWEAGEAAMRGGVHFRIPGTGQVAQMLSSGKITPRTIQLLSQDSRLLQVLPRTQVNRAAQAFRRSRLSGLLGGDRTALKAIVRSADATDEEWLQAFDAIDVDNVARGLEKAYVEEVERATVRVQRAVEDAGHSAQDAYHAMGSDVVPDGWDEPLWRQLKDLADKVGEEANTIGKYLDTDADFIRLRTDWQPSKTTPEFRQYMAAGARGDIDSLDGSMFNLAGFETKANIVDGGNFMGHPLVAASKHPDKLTPRKQAQKIIKDEVERHGEEAFEWFDDDLWVAMRAQIRTVGRRARGVHIENGMRARGHAVDAFVTTVDEVAVRATAAHRAAGRIVDSAHARTRRIEAHALAAAEAAAGGDAAAAAAAKRVRAATRARASAATGVDFPDPSSGAAGLRAAADDLVFHANETRAAMDTLDRGALDASLDLEEAVSRSEALSAKLAADVRTTREGVAELTRQQDELYAQASDAAADIDVPVEEAAERLAQAEKLQQDIAELDDMIAFAEADVQLMSASRAELDAAIGQAAQTAVATEKPLRQLEELEELLTRQRVADDRNVPGYRNDYSPEIRLLAEELGLLRPQAKPIVDNIGVQKAVQAIRALNPDIDLPSDPEELLAVLETTVRGMDDVEVALAIADDQDLRRVMGELAGEGETPKSPWEFLKQLEKDVDSSVRAADRELRETMDVLNADGMLDDASPRAMLKNLEELQEADVSDVAASGGRLVDDGESTAQLETLREAIGAADVRARGRLQEFTDEIEAARGRQADASAQATEANALQFRLAADDVARLKRAITAAEKVRGATPEGARVPNLDDVRLLRSKLQRLKDSEQRTVVSLVAERDPALEIGRQDLLDLQGWKRDTQERIDELMAIDPALARELQMVLERLKVSDVGYLSYNDQDVWFHGIGSVAMADKSANPMPWDPPNAANRGLDMGLAPDEVVRQTPELDTLVGAHFAQNGEYAVRYTAEGNMTAGGALQPQNVVGVRIRANNPVVFGDDPKMFGRGKDKPDVSDKGRHGSGLRGMHTSMIDSAHRNGLIDLGDDMLTEHREVFEQLVRSGVDPVDAKGRALFPGPTDQWNEFVDEGLISAQDAAMLRAADDASGGQMLDDMQFLEDQDQLDEFLVGAVDEAYGAELLPNFGRMNEEDLYDQVVAPWIRFGDNIFSGDTSIAAELGYEIARVWKRDMAARGYDSAVYSLRQDNGKWVVVPFSPAQVEVPTQIGRAGDRTAEAGNLMAFDDLDGALGGVVSDPKPISLSAETMEELSSREIRYALENGSNWNGDFDQLVSQTEIALATLARLAEAPTVGGDVVRVVADVRAQRAIAASAVGRWRKVAAAADGRRAGLNGKDAARVRAAAKAVEEEIRSTLRQIDQWSKDLEQAATTARELNTKALIARSDQYVTTVDDAIQASQYRRYSKVQEQFDLAGSLTPQITAMHGTANEAADALRRNTARTAELRRKAVDASKRREDGLDALELQEMEFRTQADTMLRAADDFEAKAAAKAEADLAGANVELLTAQRREASSVVESLRLQGAAAEAQAELTRVKGVAADMEARWAKMPMPDKTEAVQAVIRDGWKRVGANSMLPEEIVDGLADVNRILGHRSSSKTLHYIDTITELFKSWAIATPGFHFRNSFGGLFNNALAGVETRSYYDFMGLYAPMRDAINNGATIDGQVLAMRGSRKAQRLAKQGREDIVDNMETLIRGGALSGGQSSELARATRMADGGVRSQHWNPFNPNNIVAGSMRRPATHIENVLRGSLAMDRLSRGAGLHEAVSDIYKFHFDYDDLSAVERGVLRRAIPFYTWTRKNLPLQLEMMVSNPKVYNRVNSLKREIEREQETEELIPSWFADRFHIRLPFGGGMLGGGSGDNVTYLVPDLPFTELDRVLTPSSLVSSSNPILKVGLERLTGQNFFFESQYSDSYKPMPTAMTTLLSPLLPVLEAGGHVARRDDGRWMIKPIDRSTIESFMPPLAQASRLVPGDDPKTQDRWGQNVVNYFFGWGARVNTDLTRAAEVTSREFDQRDAARIDRSLEAPSALAALEADLKDRIMAGEFS